jgi:hypothetical protein
MDDIDLIIAAVSNTSEDILQRNKAKQETMFDKIEAEVKGSQQALYLSCVVSIVPLSSGGQMIDLLMLCAKWLDILRFC